MSLKNIVYLSEADFNTLATSGTLTKGGKTLTYDPMNDVYCVPSQTEKHNYFHSLSVSSSEGSAVFGFISRFSDAIDTSQKLFDQVADVYNSGTGTTTKRSYITYLPTAPNQVLVKLEQCITGSGPVLDANGLKFTRLVQNGNNYETNVWEDVNSPFAIVVSDTVTEI